MIFCNNALHLFCLKQQRKMLVLCYKSVDDPNFLKAFLSTLRQRDVSEVWTARSSSFE